MPEDVQPTIDGLKATITTLTAKVQALEARVTLTDQQFLDLKAAVDALSTLGKS